MVGKDYKTNTSGYHLQIFHRRIPTADPLTFIIRLHVIINCGYQTMKYLSYKLTVFLEESVFCLEYEKATKSDQI